MLKILASLFFILISSSAFAESQRNPCYTTGTQSTNGIENCIGVGTGTPLPVTGNITNLSDPIVLNTPQTYSVGSTQAVGLDQQGGLIPATGLRTAPVTCSSACTTFGSGSNGVLFTISTWPYSSVGVDVTSAGTTTTITYEASNDSPTSCSTSTNWTVITYNGAGTTTVNRLTTSTAAGIQQFDVTGVACFRARVSAYGSGTVTAGAYQTTGVPAAKGVTVNGTGAATTPAGAGSGQSVITNQNPYPAGSTAITGNSAGSTGAVVGTLAATSGKFTYICGFDVSAIGGTAAVGPVTIAGLTGSSMVFQLSSAAASATLSRTFTPCIPASASNTAITITTTADGTATAVDVNSWGFQL